MTNRLDYTKLTWGELAEVIRSVWHEMKRRNPIGINCYGAPFQTAFAYLVEIEEAEKENRDQDDRGGRLHFLTGGGDDLARL